MSDKTTSAWQSDPLLARSSARTPHFVRMHWDEQSSQAFGPWRLKEKPDPTEGLAAPAKKFTPQEPDHNNDAVGHDHEPGDAAPDEDLHSSGLDTVQAEEPAANGQGAMPGSEAMASGTAAASAPTGSAFTEHHVNAARQQGYVQGIRDGLAKAHDDTEAERQKERELVRALSIELRALGQAPQKYFEPIRRLSLHIAEQLVRGELSVTGQAIDRLVRSALDDLGAHDTTAVVTLHPDDLQRLKDFAADGMPDIRLESDPTLLSGSVRVRSNDAEIQDFIEHRLEALARRLLNHPEAWLSQSSMLKNPTVEELPSSMSNRPWRHRPVDIQDTQEKVPEATRVSAEPAAEVASPAVSQQEAPDVSSATGADTDLGSPPGDTPLDTDKGTA